MFTLAHEGHTANTPDHPLSSPDYHDTSVDSSSSYTPTETVDRSVLEAKLTLLLQLIELLQQQLASRGGIEVVIIETDNVSGSDSSSGTGIVASGNLTMTTDSNYRYFSSDSLPDYTITGGNFATEESAQDIDLKVPLNPTLNECPTYYQIPFKFGIALNGVTFEPFAAEFYNDDMDSGWQEDPFVTLRGFDDSNAHVQPTGLYHYNGVPEQFMDNRGDNGFDHSPIVGFAGDGFPVYGHHLYSDANDSSSDIETFTSSWELKSGTRSGGPGGSYDGKYNEDYEYVVNASNLDECNGRYGVTPEFEEGTYYYVLTDDFPYVPRCLMGDQDSSFVSGPAGGPPRR